MDKDIFYLLRVNIKNIKFIVRWKIIGEFVGRYYVVLIFVSCCYYISFYIEVKM